MGNCLVTKLKGVVDNDRLRKLGYVRFERFAGSLNTEILRIGSNASTIPEDFIYVHNATYTDDSGGAIITFTNEEAWLDVKKENLYSIMLLNNARGFLKFDITELVGCQNVNYLNFTGTFNSGILGSINDLVFPDIRYFSLDYNKGIVGNTRNIVDHMPLLENLYMAGTSISGIADYIVRNPSALRLSRLKILEFHSEYANANITPIRFNVSNIVICANLGCKVYIHESQVVWDTMTKEQFLETYESLPIPPVFYPAS